MQYNEQRFDDQLVDLGCASVETKGAPIVGEPDSFDLQKLQAGISDD